MDSRLEFSLPVIKATGAKLESGAADVEIEDVPRFTKDETIDVASGVVFTDAMLEVQSDDPRREYYIRRDVGDKPQYIAHWGQRKLLLNEISFLTYFWDPKKVPSPTIVYVGAAAGDHIPILEELFPQIHEFHLYDPAPFSIPQRGKIFTYNQLFTEEDAESWADQHDVFFISDIRVRKGDYDQFTDEENERGIVEDNQRQKKWVEIIKPVEAHLKFRTPFPRTEEFYEMEYFDGPIFYQPWAPVGSTETRLIPLKGGDGGYIMKKWDSRKHEEQLFYHNTVSRDNMLYSNPFMDAPNSTSIDDPELLNDYDSLAETFILKDYLEKMGKPNGEKEVVELSRYITKRLNEQGQKAGRQPKSIDSLRKFAATGKKRVFKKRSTASRRFDSKRSSPSTIGSKRPSRFPKWIVDFSRKMKSPIFYGRIQTVPESRYSSLMPQHIKQVQKIFRENVTGDVRRIVDVTAHIGVDTFLFALMYPKATIDAIEINPDTSLVLQKNVDNVKSILNNKPHATINVVNEDGRVYIEQMQARGQKADFVYFDPPWGGPDYYKKKKLVLKLGKAAVGEAVGYVLKYISDLAIVKAPVNMDMQEFRKSIKLRIDNPKISSFKIFKPQKNQKGNVAYMLHFIRK